MTRRGFTLTEVLMTVVIIGILASMAIPNYTRTLQQGRWRFARDLLQTIYFGEKFYATLNSGTYLDGLDQTQTSPDQWLQIYMDNPNNSEIPLEFSVSAPAPGNTFTATATHAGAPPCGNRYITIDQDQVFGGDWVAPGNC